MLASPTVQASEVRTAIFEGKPCINPPHVVGNYPATPFLFYIPTSGERPIKWHAENLPKGLKLDKETGMTSYIDESGNKREINSSDVSQLVEDN